MDKISKNPYQPPSSDIEQAGPHRSGPLKPAGRGRRFVNYLIDLTAIYASAILTGIILYSLFGEEWLAATFRRGFEYIFGAGLIFLSYTLFEGLFGFTPGKLATGTRVVSEDGSRPGLGSIVGRSLTRLVPFEPLSMFSGSQRAWHDRWPGTLVVVVR